MSKGKFTIGHILKLLNPVTGDRRLTVNRVCFCVVNVFVRFCVSCGIVGFLVVVLHFV